MTLEELTPGDLIRLSGRTAVFIGFGLYPGSSSLRSVVWKLDTGEWSVDALRVNQEVGELVPSRPDERNEQLIRALESGGPSR